MKERSASGLEQGQVVFECLAETDARVESDPLPVDASGNRRVAAGGQIREGLNAYPLIDDPAPLGQTQG